MIATKSTIFFWGGEDFWRQFSERMLTVAACIATGRVHGSWNYKKIFLLTQGLIHNNLDIFASLLQLV